MAVFVIGVSHRTSPVELRERLAFAETDLPEALRRLRADGLAEEAVIVSTCNRVEVYGASGSEGKGGPAAVCQFLLARGNVAQALTNEVYSYAEPESLHHLFRVVSGLDSMVLGETEILGQVKRAYDLALQAGSTGRRLNKAFQRAFNVAKQIRTETSIQRGSVSVGSVAVDLAEHIFSSLRDRTILVIGAGDTGEKTARALMSRGTPHLLVTNRSFERAQTLAADLGGRALPFADWSGEFAPVDIVISSTAAPHYILDRARLETLMVQRQQRPLLLIDIAVPRDIDPEANLLENVFLYNIDDLQTIADEALRQRQDEIARCEKIIAQKARDLLDSQHARSPGESSLAYGC